MPAAQRHPHEILLDELRQEYKAILDGSKQAIYVYLDNEHKICNERFAAMIGYKSPKEYAETPDPLVDVDENSVNTLATTYQKAMEQKIGSSIEVTFKRHGGGSVKTNVILVPISYKSELMALHYITAK